MEAGPSRKITHHKKQINRKTKLHLVFDHEARREYLSGFHKRKLQRKKKAQEELEERIKEERKRLKQEARKNYKKLLGEHRTIPGIEDLATEKIELDKHSVSIVELSPAELAEKNNWIGPNKVHYKEEKPATREESDEEDELPGMELKSVRDVKKVLKKQATKEVKKSKAFQMKEKIQAQKSRKKAKRQKRQNIKMRLKKGKGKKGGGNK